MVTAKFLSKQFEVSSKKIYTPNGLTLSEELNVEETEVSEKKPTVSFKKKLQNLSFDVKLDSRFVDVQKEIEDWRKLMRNQLSDFFILGNFTLGKYFLTKVDVKDISIAKSGDYTGATISLSLIEDGKYYNDELDKKAKETATNVANAVINGLTGNNVTSVITSAVKTASTKVRKGSTIKPKNGVRWYYTAEGAIKKTGKSGKAYQKNMTVTYTYAKSGKIVCVNPQGLGWLKVEDVTVVKY